jgi:cell wall-associated NlpC family hydrolase
MTRPFYHNAERLFQLAEKAEALMGTPFAFNAMVPQAGIDCVHVCAWVYLQTGFLKAFNPPPYALDSATHTADSQLLGWFATHPEFEEVVKLKAGDSICFNLGLSEHHVGLMDTDFTFVHVMPRPGKAVARNSVAAEHYYRRRVTHIFRPIEQD